MRAIARYMFNDIKTPISGVRFLEHLSTTLVRTLDTYLFDRVQCQRTAYLVTST